MCKWRGLVCHVPRSHSIYTFENKSKELAFLYLTLSENESLFSNERVKHRARCELVKLHWRSCRNTKRVRPLAKTLVVREPAVLYNTT